MKFVSTLGIVLLLGTTSFAQSSVRPNPNPNPNPNRPNRPNVPADPNANLANDILTYERTQNADALLLAYGQAVTDPALARAAIAQLLSSYYLLRNQAQTADQATQAVSEANLRFQVLQAAQNQVIIKQNQQLLDQNAQIIKLLQMQVNKTR